jgi:hypothetical protein
MNASPGLLTRLWLLVRLPARVRESPPVTRSHRSARAAVLWFFAGTLAISCATLLATDVFAPIIRDPEYGWRAARLRDRVAEYPDRPLVLFVGSSRVGGAVAGAEWETLSEPKSTRPTPFLFNMGRAGAGPLLQLMTLKRNYAAGIRPALVLLEYWPPMMSQTKDTSDFKRIAPDQVFAGDLPFVRDYAEDGGEFERAVWRSRLNPIWRMRLTFMQQLEPEWLAWAKRMEILWVFLDRWGWLPGADCPTENSTERIRKVSNWAETFRPQFRSFQITPRPDRALRESVALAREHGAAVGFVYLPESSEFRSWYPAKAEQMASEYLRSLSEELHVPVINARTWLDDGCFADGFHLSKIGGIDFSRKLAPAVKEAFPELWQ